MGAIVREALACLLLDMPQEAHAQVSASFSRRHPLKEAPKKLVRQLFWCLLQRIELTSCTNVGETQRPSPIPLPMPKPWQLCKMQLNMA